MNFTKMQGAGNDFILVETSDVNWNWSKMALAMCNRRFGIGADGLLLLLPSDVADFRMREFNPDGSEAKACGNGLRCLAKYVIDKGLLSRKFEGGEVNKESLDKGLANIEPQEISVETLAGVRKARLHYEAKLEKKKPKGKLKRGEASLTQLFPLSFKGEGDKGGEVVRIQVGMGKPGFGAKDISVVIEPGDRGLVDIKPMLTYSITIQGRELLLNFVSMGNPHAVYFDQNPVSEFPLSQLGPQIELHKLFPDRVNFEVARVISRRQIEARIWERGVGETLACGSGACAVAVAARLHGYIDSKVDIKLPGGILGVEWDKVGEVLLNGPAETVFTGQWPTKGVII